MGLHDLLGDVQTQAQAGDAGCTGAALEIGWLPLLLPFAGIAWLWHTGRARSA